ncbi:MAG: response regulator, partial [Clostridia bacterium]
MYKVLLVEDEDLIRKGLRYAIDWQSVDCVVVGEAENGEEGLSLIKKLQPDIVVTDVKMPGLDGLEMLRAGASLADCKAIIISGYDEFAYAQKAVSLGVTEYLLKPIDFDMLYAALRKVAKEKSADRKVRALLENDQFRSSGELLNIAQQAENKHVRFMLDYIENHYGQRISLTDVSLEQDVSCAYLNAKFKLETGYPFNDYLNRYRILRATEMIRENRLKIYEIAEQVGFLDYKYFIKVFKKYTGFSPGRFGNF